MEWWLTIILDGRVHCWPIGDTTAAAEDMVMRARASVGFPPGDAWIHAGDERRRVQLAPGRPHPRMWALAEVHDLTHLLAVPDTTLAEYAAQHQEAGSAARVRAARDVLAGLTLQERDAATAVQALPSRRVT